MTDLLGVLQDDISHVHVRVTAAVGIAAVFVTQIPLGTLRKQPEGFRVLTVVGIVFLLCAAALYFQYSQQLNKLRLKIVAERLEDGVGGWAKSWTDWKKIDRGGNWHPWDTRLYMTAEALLFVGLVCVGVDLGWLILSK